MTTSGLGFLVKGLAIGFSIAAPVGPIGLLCLRRTLAYGRLSGFVTGLGAATADALYSSVAGFGLTAVSSLLVQEEQWVRAVGGVFLLYLGLSIARAGPRARAAEGKDAGLLWDYLSTLALTLTNPITILSFAAIFTGFGLVRAHSHTAAAALVLGVFLGSCLWWFLLSHAVGALRERFSPALRHRVNLLSGLLICAFAAVILGELLKQLLTH